MPFTGTPTRTQQDLTEFFTTNLKGRIETEKSFAHRYVVSRSDDTFNITDQIVKDLYEADIVLCDLSGHHANPNVMYELGVRLAVTNKPVILFREASAGNVRIFDIQGFYAFEYSTARYRELEAHIVDKIAKFESGDEVYESPVLKILRQQPSVAKQVRRERLVGLLRMMHSGVRYTFLTIETAIDRFLLARCGIELPDGTTTTFFVATDQRMPSLDWAALAIRPRVLPAIQTFLSDTILTDLVGAAEEQLITTFVTRYYAQYYAFEELWATPTYEFVSAFLIDTLAFDFGLAALVDSLTANDEAFSQLAFMKAVRAFSEPQHIIATLRSSDVRLPHS